MNVMKASFRDTTCIEDTMTAHSVLRSSLAMLAAFARGCVMRCVLMLALAAILPATATAQALTVSAGPSLPQGEMARRRTVGAQAALAIGSEQHTRDFQYRIELSYARFAVSRSYAATPAGRDDGPLSIVGGMFYLLYTAAPSRISLHGGLGAGVYDLSIPGRPDPYGRVGGIGLLFGAKLGRERVRGLVEIQQQLVLSDYGNGDFNFVSFVPLRFGVIVQ